MNIDIGENPHPPPEQSGNNPLDCCLRVIWEDAMAQAKQRRNHPRESADSMLDSALDANVAVSIIRGKALDFARAQAMIVGEVP